MLIILDGWGHGPKPAVSAITQAKTPFVDNLYQQYPNSELVTYGEDVGLPAGQMGNSEVGHLNIGAGRVVYQELARINKAISDRQLHQNEVLVKALQYAKEQNVAVHLIGLVSDGGVHSHINHLKALCDITQEQACDKVFVHAFTDGRDTAPTSGLGFLQELEAHIKKQDVQLASIIGRYYAMDRDKRWERVKLAYDLLVRGEGQLTQDFEQAVRDNYAQDITDEFLKPIILSKADGTPRATIRENDVVICFNYRTDRPREITEVLTQNNMPEFDMQKLSLRYLTMTRYDEAFKGIEVLFTKDDIRNTLGEVLANQQYTQLRIAETEKYPHVTFFFSGGREAAFEGEERILIPSPKVATYDLQPEMSAVEMTDALLNRLEQTDPPNFVCLNYANTDMVGHTGVFSAAIKAAETVDTCLQRLVPVALEKGYELLVIADHGNSDYMINDDGSPHTAHTLNPVPCIYVSKNNNSTLHDGRLADVAPTLMEMMQIEPSPEMDGQSLIVATT